jgi:hypothetical protein
MIYLFIIFMLLLIFAVLVSIVNDISYIIRRKNHEQNQRRTRVLLKEKQTL